MILMWKDDVQRMGIFRKSVENTVISRCSGRTKREYESFSVNNIYSPMFQGLL